jgi:hypothetical protein
VLLLTFAVPWLTVNRSLWGASIVLAIATVLLWAPGRGPITTEADYFQFYLAIDPGHTRPHVNARAFGALTLTAVALAVAGSLAACAERRLREGGSGEPSRNGLAARPKARSV